MAQPSFSSNNPDGSSATPAPGAPPPPRGSNRRCHFGSTTAVGWPPCWLVGSRAWNNTADDPPSADQDQTTRCSSGICGGLAKVSSCAETAKNPAAKKTKKKTRKKIQPEEGRRVLGRSGRRKRHGRKRNFKPPLFPHFHSAADSVIHRRMFHSPLLQIMLKKPRKSPRPTFISSTRRHKCIDIMYGL